MWPKIEQFCQDIVEALRKPWMSPEERSRIEEAEAQRRANEGRRPQAAAAQLQRAVDEAGSVRAAFPHTAPTSGE
jgi:hypothetical protein